MIKLIITNEVVKAYKLALKKALLTPKEKKFSVATKRFYQACKKIGFKSYSDVYKNLLVVKDINGLVLHLGIQTFTDNEVKIYDELRKDWAAKLVDLLELKVCPYCNRNFIHNFDGTMTTVELDHFYPKNKYPYLSISLYNLVPSCHTCNHKKGEQIKNTFHPYLESFNAIARFEYEGIAVQPKGKNYDFFDEKRIKLGLHATNTQEEGKVNSHKSVFNLDSLYANHKDIVQELIQKSQIYPESYIDDLGKQYVGKVFNSRDELLRLITGGHVTDEEINHRPLNKLVKDISQQLEIY